MVEQLEAHDGGGLADAVREGAVVRGWGGVAGGVVVREEEAACTDPQHGAENAARCGATHVGGAPGDGDDGERSEVRVDGSDPEFFVLEEAELCK